MATTDPTQRSFFGALFDFSFKSYVTPKIIKIIFAMVIVLSGLGALGFVVFAFSANVVAGVFVLLIVAPLVFLFYVILYRVFLEVVMAVFAIAENTSRLAHPLPGSTGPTPVDGYVPGPAGAASPA